MPYIKKHEFDEKVTDRINSYIEKNNLSIKKIASASGMTYQQVYQFLHKRQLIKLREYILLCKVFDEPLDKFIEDINPKA